jgi:hypothetical protein
MLDGADWATLTDRKDTFLVLFGILLGQWIGTTIGFIISLFIDAGPWEDSPTATITSLAFTGTAILSVLVMVTLSAIILTWIVRNIYEYNPSNILTKMISLLNMAFLWAGFSIIIFLMALIAYFIPYAVLLFIMSPLPAIFGKESMDLNEMIVWGHFLGGAIGGLVSVIKVLELLSLLIGRETYSRPQENIIERNLTYSRQLEDNEPIKRLEPIESREAAITSFEAVQQEAESEPKSFRTCPRCRTAIPPRSWMCPKCGYR